MSLSIIANPKFGLPFGTVPPAIACMDMYRSSAEPSRPHLGLAGVRTNSSENSECARTAGPSAPADTIAETVFVDAVHHVPNRRTVRAEEHAYCRRGICAVGSSPADDRMLWGSSLLRLSNTFFKNITDSPVPIDMCSVALSKSPLAMDIYSGWSIEYFCCA
ncbi:MAG: hypothetical protein IPG25_15700 [Proteobacteria bacterium]|nr:hypothetical protein [Pseudomonadota bacterium]